MANFKHISIIFLVRKAKACGFSNDYSQYLELDYNTSINLLACLHEYAHVLFTSLHDVIFFQQILTYVMTDYSPAKTSEVIALDCHFPKNRETIKTHSLFLGLNFYY